MPYQLFNFIYYKGMFISLKRYLLLLINMHIRLGERN